MLGRKEMQVLAFPTGDAWLPPPFPKGERATFYAMFVERRKEVPLIITTVITGSLLLSSAFKRDLVSLPRTRHLP